MRLSIIALVGNEKRRPNEGGEAFEEALACFKDLADEVIIIDGSETYRSNDPKVKVVPYLWNYEWNWDHLPRALNTGLRVATGDIVMRCDIDYFFHENDIQKIRDTLENLSRFPIIDFQKHVFVTEGRYYQKGRVPMCINKSVTGESIQFGRAVNAETDLCYPINVEGEKDGVPYGIYKPTIHVKSRMPVYVYDYSFKIQEETMEEFARFARAYKRYYGEAKWGSTMEESFEVFRKMMSGRLNRCVYKVGDDNSIKTHPKYIKDKIENLTEDQFAHSGWDLL